jgi:hypothetical protein
MRRALAQFVSVGLLLVMSTAAATTVLPGAAAATSRGPAVAAGIPEQADLCAQVANQAGFNGGYLVLAVAVALAESRCVPSAVNTNGPTSGCSGGSRDRGLWQINDCYHPSVTDACAFTPQCNADAAFSISSGGVNWHPWSTYNNGLYTAWLDDAQAAVDRLGPPPKTHLLWMQRSSLSGGTASRAFVFGLAGDLPLVGDWNGDGVESPGVYRPSTAEFHLSNSNDGGSADLVVRYGTPGQGQWPVVGDWDGNGTDTIGLFDTNTAQWLLRNTNSVGSANVTFTYGQPGDVPLPGDWDGDGDATPGVLRSTTWLLRNTNSAGTADHTFPYGRAGDFPVVGDWNNSGGSDGIGVVRGNQWLLRYSLGGGDAQVSFTFGRAGDVFAPGDWNGNGQPDAGIVRAV